MSLKISNHNYKILSNLQKDCMCQKGERRLQNFSNLLDETNNNFYYIRVIIEINISR